MDTSVAAVAIGLLGVAMTIIAFFLKRTLVQLENAVSGVKKVLDEIVRPLETRVAVLEEWRKSVEHKLDRL